MSVPPTRIVYADDACCIAVRGALALSVWPGAPTLARLTRAWEIVRDEARTRGAPLVLLSVVPGGAPLVALADLPAIGREMMASRSATLALCIAFEGHGPWAERALEVATLADAARIGRRRPVPSLHDVGRGGRDVAGGAAQEGRRRDAGPRRDPRGGRPRARRRRSVTETVQPLLASVTLPVVR